MTVRVGEDGEIILEGAAPIEDAEVLLQKLLIDPQALVDWRNCRSAHAAVVQLLILSNAVLIGPPMGDFLREFVAPAISRVDDKANSSPAAPKVRQRIGGQVGSRVGKSEYGP